MGLFDETEEVRPADDDKNRLFETHQRAGRSIRDYVKFLIPIVLVVIVGIAAVIFYSRPGVGDKVRPEQGLYDAVNDHMLMQQKRQPVNMEFYYCGEYYAAEITVEPRPPAASSKWEDSATAFKAVAHENDDGTWQVNAFALRPKEPFFPCERSPFAVG
jgi:hypothetical protein